MSLVWEVEMDRRRWRKSCVTLTEIEGKRDEAAKALQGFLKGLGYV
jgi:type I restriction enzyme M protein